MSAEEYSSVGDFGLDFDGQDPVAVAVEYPYTHPVPIR